MISNYLLFENTTGVEIDWTDIPITNLNQDELKAVWNMYVQTYSSIGMVFKNINIFYNKSKNKIVKLIDTDNDSVPNAFLLYRNQYGYKITIMGSDNSPKAKSELVSYLLKLLSTRGWWMEAGQKVSEILNNNQIPYVIDENIISRLVDEDVRHLKDGYFEKILAGSSIKNISRIYGSPLIN